MNQFGIIAQYTYETIECALTNQGHIVSTQTIHKFKAVSDFIPTIDSLLTSHNLTLENLAFLGANTGPGPFNTLRAMLVTVNGLSAPHHTPLVTTNAFELLCTSTQTVALLHAFGNDVYLGYTKEDKLQILYCSIDQAISILSEEVSNSSMTLVGNGALKHQVLLQTHFPKAAYHTQILFSSLESLASKSYELYSACKYSDRALPLYAQSPVIK